MTPATFSPIGENLGRRHIPDPAMLRFSIHPGVRVAAETGWAAERILMPLARLEWYWLSRSGISGLTGLGEPNDPEPDAFGA
jgi:hypothetical protein